MKMPTLEEILQDTETNRQRIENNIALMSTDVPTNLVEEPTNTNMLLIIKRYILALKGAGIYVSSEDFSQIFRLVSISDNVTNTSFVRLTELLKVRWEIRLINPNHDLFLVADTNRIFDENKKMSIECDAGNLFLSIMRYVLDNYGNVDLRLNTKYVPAYNVSNILAAIRGGKNISSYLFEKFCKMWNISYSYEMISLEKDSVRMRIVMDPSGWI